MNSNIKEIAEQYANQVWNNKDLKAVDKIFHPDAVIHSTFGDFKGTKAMQEVIKAWLKGFPDLCVDNDMIICDKDLVTIQWRANGTHMGEFKGRKPTKKPISYRGVTTYRIQEGKIIEYWATLDLQNLLNQID